MGQAGHLGLERALFGECLGPEHARTPGPVPARARACARAHDTLGMLRGRGDACREVMLDPQTALGASLRGPSHAREVRQEAERQQLEGPRGGGHASVQEGQGQGDAQEGGAEEEAGQERRALHMFLGVLSLDSLHSSSISSNISNQFGCRP